MIDGRFNLIDSPTERTLLELWHEKGNAKARKKLIISNMRLVIRIASKIQKHYKSLNLDMDDLISEGTLGLIKSIDDFDLRHEVKLATFAYRGIMWKILNYVRVGYPTIRVPSSIPNAEYEEYVYNSRQISELSKFTEPETCTNIIDEWIDEQEYREDCERIRKVVATFPQREQKIHRLRMEGRTLQEVANEQGVSKERIRQIVQKMLERLREELR